VGVTEALESVAVCNAASAAGNHEAEEAADKVVEG
jgi:hypothetical protein